jgi:hypothetical protein
MLRVTWFGRGDSEMLSFAYGAIVIALTIVAKVRITRSKGQLRGITFCAVGLITGGHLSYTGCGYSSRWSAPVGERQ